MRTLTLLSLLALGCAEPVPPPPGATLAPQAAPAPAAPAPSAAPAPAEADDELLSVALAAALDDPSAQYNLAVRFFSGEGVPADPEAAAHLWAAVVDATGDSSAQSNLGYLLLQSEGDDAKHQRAVEYLLAAAGGGHVEAPVHLGRAYLDGRGVSADPIEAWAWAEVGRRRAASSQGSISQAVAANAEQLQSEAAPLLDQAGLAQARQLADQRQPQ